MGPQIQCNLDKNLSRHPHQNGQGYSKIHMETEGPTMVEATLKTKNKGGKLTLTSKIITNLK